MTLRLRDVTLRDGLQNTKPISTGDKLLLFDALVFAGVSDLELTSFAHPDHVPAMADADRFTRAALERGSPATLWGLVMNPKGAERALAAGLRHLQYVVSVSERHSIENTGQTVQASLKGLSDVVSMANESRAVVETTLGTAFGCPFEGPVSPVAVLEVARKAIDCGISGISLADTIGVAMPNEVATLVSDCLDSLEVEELGIHLHNTRGVAIANALSALDAGATRLDGTLGGLGGCPFAPGASGNLVLEDLVHALEAMGAATGIKLSRLIEASKLACELTGHKQESHVVIAGPRFTDRPTLTAGMTMN